VDILVIKMSSSDKVVDRFWKSVGRRKDEGGGEYSDKYEYDMHVKCLRLKISIGIICLCRLESHL
jgi:hypothetical protein